MHASKRIASLDGLRAVSIALVCLSHLFTTDHYPNNALTRVLSDFGHFGVDVFFVLSGYLITTLLEAERARTGRISLFHFYHRRAFRILPASLVYTIFAIFGTFALGGTVAPRYIVAAFTFGVGYVPHFLKTWQLAHLWSLGAEEQFYLLWPLTLVACYRARVAVAYSIILLSTFCRMQGVVNPSYSFPCVADCMAIGCLLAIYAPRLSQCSARFWCGPVTLSLCGLCLASGYAMPSRNVAYWSIEPILIAATLFCLIQRADPILNNRPIQYCGTLSYSLYLAQQPFFNRYAHTPFNAFPLNIVCALLAALALHYGVEKPMLRIGAERRQRAIKVESVAAELQPG